MVAIRVPRGWEIPEREVTPEAHIEASRRDFLLALGWGALGSGALISACSAPADPPEGGPRLDPNPPGGAKLYPAKLNPDFADAGRPPTLEAIAASSNKFYEFSMDKVLVWKKIKSFHPRPWSVEVAGLCNKPRTFDIDELARLFPLEERIYRHRCVEGWAKTIPWTGFPLRLLLEAVEPKAEANFVHFTTFFDPQQAMQQHSNRFPWPYTEALTLKEARNELALLVTGVYGHGLQKQFGAPVRLVVPWRYALKSIKSIVRIELTAAAPDTFWNTISVREVDWTANVDPKVPHPRWNQTGEWLLGPKKMATTEVYNGYGKWVADLYKV